MKKVVFNFISPSFFNKKGVFIYPTKISMSSEVSSKIENTVREFGGIADHYKIQIDFYTVPVYYFPTREGFIWFKKSIELEFDK